jgi:spore coat polysaccharide biosynthesis protein SpsF
MSGECMDILVSEMEKNGYDYAFMNGLPIGVSPEVVRRNCFDKISQNTELSDRDKEHVTIYFKEHPDEYNIGYVEAPTKYYYPNLSLTIDTEEQYLQIKELYDKHGCRMTLEKALGELNAIK